MQSTAMYFELPGDGHSTLFQFLPLPPLSPLSHHSHPSSHFEFIHE